jgi:3-dehydroquinate dehydratase-1
MKLCGCVNGKTIEECQNLVRDSDVDLIEHRIDLLTEKEPLEEFYNEIKIPIIATCHGDEDRLKEAIASGCSYIDIDQGYPEKEKLIRLAKEEGVKIILSYHDHDSTPTDDILHSLLDRMEGADIIKIVTTPKVIREANRILQLYFDHSGPLIAFGMGPQATFTRAISLLYGAPFAYVSIGEPTAPGQIDAESMRKLLEVIS